MQQSTPGDDDRSMQQSRPDSGVDVTAPVEAYGDQVKSMRELEAPAPESPFLENSGRAQSTIVMLTAVAAVSLLQLGVAIYQFLTIIRLTNGVSYATETLSAGDQVYTSIDYVATLLYLSAGIVFMMWFYRAHRNLDQIPDAEPRFDPEWTYLGFIIPIMNLFRPFQMMNDLWIGTHGNGRSMSVVRIWWVCYLAMTVAGLLVLLTLDFERMAVTVESIGFEVIAVAFTAAGAIMMILMVKSIQSAHMREEDRQLRELQLQEGARSRAR